MSFFLDAVSSAVLHPTGTVLATCSGQRHLGERAEKKWEGGEESDDEKEENEDSEESSSSSRSSVLASGNSEGWDNSLKVWAL